MTDLVKFAKALNTYITCDKCSNEERVNKYIEFQSQIEGLNCYDFRFYFYRAHYMNCKNQMEKAKCYIDKAIQLMKVINYSILKIDGNGEYLYIPDSDGTKLNIVTLGPIKEQISKVYSCAGEIYAKIDNENSSLKYYQIANYYNSFFKSEFDTQKK